MKRLTSQRRRAASHEAGHAVAALVHGVKFSHVWIADDDTSIKLGSLKHLDDWAAGEVNREGIEAMAGLAGERVALGQPCGECGEADTLDSASGDFPYIVNLYVGAEVCIHDVDDEASDWDDAPYFAVKFVNQCLRKAYKLLTKHRTLHERLTDALVECGRLDYSECLAIFEPRQTIVNTVRCRCKRDQHLWTSLHEAAHAIFALRLGLPFEEVVVFDFDRQVPIAQMMEDQLTFGDDNLGGLVAYDGGTLEVRALVALAGVAFEGWMGNRNGSQTDFELAVETVGRKALGTLIPQASKMLMQEFDSIVRLGDELYRRGRMTETECRELLGEGVRR